MARVRRVLLISGEYPPMEGGVADFTHLLGLAMAEQGMEVHVLTSVKGTHRRVTRDTCPSAAVLLSLGTPSTGRCVT